MLKPIGKGKFVLDYGNQKFIYDNRTSIVSYEFENEGPVELEVEEIPEKVKKVIMDYVPETIKYDLIMLGW